jgi:hypothetical protein
MKCTKRSASPPDAGDLEEKGQPASSARARSRLRQPVKLEHLSNQTSDLAVGVVGTEDHLDHMSNGSFDRPEEFGGW